MGVGFFGGSFGLGVMEGLGGWLVGGRAGILKSRMGSFLGWELWRARGIACCCGARCGGQISTVDCSRVLNVNKSLYGSTSRVERSE